MVVDLVNIGIGRRCLWPYILISVNQSRLTHGGFIIKGQRIMANLHFFYGMAGTDIAAKLIQDRHEFLKRYNDVWVLQHKDGETSDKKITSQTGLECPAHTLSQIKWQDIIRRREFYYGAIMINNIHLYKPADIDNLVKLADTYSRMILCYGLMTDPTEHLYPASKHLLEVGAKLHEIPCVCQMLGCNNHATHSLVYHRLGYVIKNPKTSDVAEAERRYKSVCRICYDRESRNKR